MKRLIAFVFVSIYVLAMAGCTQNRANRGTILGSWEAEIEVSLLGVSVADDNGPQSVAAIYSFNFFEDGTGERCIIIDEKYTEHLPNANEHFTYILDGDELTLTYENENSEKFTVSFSDEKLILDGRVRLELVPKKQ